MILYQFNTIILMPKFAQYSISPKVEDLNDPTIHDKIQWIKKRIPEGESDLVIAIGGDGEALKAFHKFPDKILLGLKIEDGRSLGFYSALDLLEVNDSIINKIVNNDFQILSLSLLDYVINDKKLFVINDICVQRRLNGKTGKFIVKVGDDVFNASGDGVIICTPSGSSGYNFSSGGSIITWDLHAYSVRFFNLIGGLRSISIVVKGDITTKIESTYDCIIESDGIGEELSPKTIISANLSDKSSRLAYFEYHGQLSRLKRMIKSSNIE